jgi:glycosyltransferase involved in cell wall biosynthesis
MTIYRIPAWHILNGQFTLPNIVSLVRWLLHHPKGSYDIVHTHIRFFDATWWAWAYAKAIGAVSVFTEHVASHPIHQYDPVTTIAKIIDVTLAKWSVKKYDCVTVTNKSARTFLKYVTGVTQTVYLTYGGVDTDYFSPKRRKKRHIPHIAKTFGNADTIITYAGRIIWSKGMTYFYRAVRDSITSFPKRVYVVFAGPGDLLPDIREEIAKDNLEDRIFTTGSLEAKEVRDLLRATDIFVHPSHHNEGFPNVILEAGATENFVIATKNAGVEEAITDKKTGLIIEQKNEADMRRTMRWAVEHSDARRAMAHAFRKVIRRKFEWNNLSERFYILLKRSFERQTVREAFSHQVLKNLALS